MEASSGLRGSRGTSMGSQGVKGDVRGVPEGQGAHLESPRGSRVTSVVSQGINDNI